MPKDSLTTSLSGSKSNNDLLGINFGDSIFTGTGTNQSLKANAGSASDSDLFAAFDGKSGQVKTVKDEEDDFFNQKAPDMTKKLDTNSILKLYESSNNSSNFFSPIATMTSQPTSLNQQLPFGMQAGNPVQTQQPFGTFNQPLVPGISQPSVASNGLPGSLLANSSIPSQIQVCIKFSKIFCNDHILSQTSSPFGGPAAAVTNPFLVSPPMVPTSQISGFGVNQPEVGVQQVRFQFMFLMGLNECYRWINN